MVDFGMQLYLPWRISNGLTLYADQDYFYGPLSQYADAALFRVFGPDMMILVEANLVVYAAILACTYILYRRAWGVGAALVALAVFSSVFSFSQFSMNANYNYAAPYAHEATHGLLLDLLLIVVLTRWVEHARPGRSFAAGFLFGLTLLLKPEIMLGAALVLAAAVLAQSRFRAVCPRGAWSTMAGGVLLPSALFTLYFATRMPLPAALAATGHGWLAVFATGHYTGSALQQQFLGFDHIPENLGRHLTAGVLAGLLVAGLAAAGRGVEALTSGRAQIAALVAFLVVVLILALAGIDWIQTGRCLTLLSFAYWAWCLSVLFRAETKPEERGRMVARLLLATLAVALLVRMILNARIYQYGFYQAVLAATMFPAVLIGELPAWARLGNTGARTIVLGVLALFIPGAVILAGQSLQILSLKTVPIGNGADRFYALLPEIDPMGEAFRWTMGQMAPARPNETLMVLPPDFMLNYQLRLPSPQIPPDGVSDSAAGESALVVRLEQNPPDWVVFFAGELRGPRAWDYGETPDKGQQVLAWVRGRYNVVGSFCVDPRIASQPDVIIYRPKTPTP